MRGSAARLAPVMVAASTGHPSLPGYALRVLDGNHLPGSDKRLKPLRAHRGAALPGLTLVVYDPATGLAVDLVAAGSRITRKSVSTARRFLPVAIGGTLTLLVWTVLLSLALGQVSSIGFEALVLGTAPGGAAETGLTARALHLNVGDVTAFHLVRIHFIVLLSAPLDQLAVRRGQDRPR